MKIARSAIAALVLFLSALLACACPRSPRMDRHQLVEHSRRSTATLATLSTGNEWSAFCTGVFVAEFEILTAEHCVDDVQEGESVLFATYDDCSLEDNSIRKVHLARVVRRASDKDLALLRFDYPLPHDVAALSPAVDDGEEILVVGHPGRMLYTVFNGVVVAHRKGSTLHGMDVTLQVSAPVWRGNSGGGAFDYSGRLVGIAQVISFGIPLESWFASPENIAAFLREK